VIVAWHGVPGTAPPQKGRPVGYGLISAGVASDSTFQTSETLLGSGAIAHSALVSQRFRKESPERGDRSKVKNLG